MAPRHRRLRVPAMFVALATLAACSGGSKSSSGSGSKSGLVAQVASFDLVVGGPQRILVGLLSSNQQFIVYGTVQLRFAYLGTKQDNKPGAYGPAVTASFLPIPGSTLPSPVPSSPTLTSGVDVKGVYAAQGTFPNAGFYQAEATATVGGKTESATSAFAVNDSHQVPGVGDSALPTANLTLSSPGVPLTAVDSAATNGTVPDPQLHMTTVAAALAAKRPIVLVISTPVFCQSRFCGPVTDMVASLATKYADRASFVHIEVYKDGQNQVVNQAAADWILANGAPGNEPWVFFIGANGKIAARFDNVATQGELEPLLQALPVIGPAT